MSAYAKHAPKPRPHSRTTLRTAAGGHHAARSRSAEFTLLDKSYAGRIVWDRDRKLPQVKPRL